MIDWSFIDDLKADIQPRILQLGAKIFGFKEVLWLIGDGRSGTTWISSLINHQKEYRELFEPFHPCFVDGMEWLQGHHYLSAREKRKDLLDSIDATLTGKFVHPRVDEDTKGWFYQKLLIKDVFANLLAYEAYRRNSHIKPILIIRNPFAVALSKAKKSDWYWVRDPLELLEQKELSLDFLAPFKDLIIAVAKEGDFILNQVLIWSIINYIPLKQFSKNELYILFYEDIFTNPHDELERLFHFISDGSCHKKLSLSDEEIRRPSKVVGSESNILSQTSPITSWKKEITPKQFKKGKEILSYFGFETLYNEEGMPNRTIIEAIMN